MSVALDAAGSVELAVVERSGMIESRHLGAAAVVDGDGALVRTLGDSAALIYPRSTLKPIQAVAMLRASAPLSGARLVLATASHCGSPEHLAVVRGILEAVELGADDLQCPADWPLGREFANDLVRAGEKPGRLHMNCSGKHAGFLSAAVTSGWSTKDYLEPDHAMQVLVRETVEEFTGETIEHSGVDGCGAPVHAVTLGGLARAIGRVSGSTSRDEFELASAIRENPWAIDGHGRANTLVIEQLGLIAKLGAEGVMVMGAPDGSAVAVKILDGSLRAATLVAIDLLARVGTISLEAAAGVLEATTERVLGGGREVGDIRVAY